MRYVKLTKSVIALGACIVFAHVSFANQDAPVIVTDSEVFAIGAPKPLGFELPGRKPSPGQVKAVAFSPDGRMVLGAGIGADYTLTPNTPRSGLLGAWDLQTKQQVSLAPKDFVLDLKSSSPAIFHAGFFADGKRILTVFEGGEAFVYEAKSAKTPRPMPLRGPLSIEAAAFNGKQLLLDAADNSFQLWDAESGKAVRLFAGHAGSLTCIAFLPSGQKAMSAADDGSVRLWDVKSGKMLQRLDQETVQHLVALGDNQHAFFARRDGSLQLWNLDKWQEVHTWTGPAFMKVDADGKRATLEPGVWADVTSLAAAPKNSHVLIGLRDGTIRLWNVTENKELFLFVGHAKEYPVTSLAFAPDGKTFLSGSGDGTMRLWTIPDEKLARPAAPLVGKPRAAFVPPATAPALSLRTGAPGQMLAAAFSRDGTRAVTSSTPPPFMKMVASSPPNKNVQGIPAAAFPGIGLREDSVLRVWSFDPVGEIRRTTVLPSGITCIALSTSGKTALTGCGGPMPGDNSAGVWDLETGKLLRSFKGHGGGVGSVAFSADGKRAVSGATRTPGIVEPLRDFTVMVWEVATTKLTARLTGHFGPVNSVAFSPDGKFILTAAGQVFRGGPAPQMPGGKQDDSIRIWDSIKSKQILELPGHSGGTACAVYSPDGKQILSGGADKVVRLWDAKSGKEIRRMEGHTATVNTVTFSADGKYALSGGGLADGSVRLWDVETGKEVLKVGAGGSGVMAVAFAPGNGRILAAADESVRVWRNPIAK